MCFYPQTCVSLRLRLTSYIYQVKVHTPSCTGVSLSRHNLVAPRLTAISRCFSPREVHRPASCHQENQGWTVQGWSRHVGYSGSQIPPRTQPSKRHRGMQNTRPALWSAPDRSPPSSNLAPGCIFFKNEPQPRFRVFRYRPGVNHQRPLIGFPPS